MKKIIWVLMLCFAGGAVSAEDLSFVTTLSSPVGTFSMLEAADSQTNATAAKVNFCNTRVGTGQVKLTGTLPSFLENLIFSNGTTMGGDVPEFRVVNYMEIFNSISLKGGRLMAQNIGFSNVTSAKSKIEGTLYGTTAMAVKGSATEALVIPSQSVSSGRGTGKKMHWSNEYKRDYDCSTIPCTEKGSSYTSYLLKSLDGTATLPPDPEEPELTWHFVKNTMVVMEKPTIPGSCGPCPTYSLTANSSWGPPSGMVYSCQMVAGVGGNVGEGLTCSNGSEGKYCYDSSDCQICGSDSVGWTASTDVYVCKQ